MTGTRRGCGGDAIPWGQRQGRSGFAAAEVINWMPRSVALRADEPRPRRRANS